MDVQTIISSGLTDIATALVSVLIAMAGLYLRQHFTSKQLSTAASIASEAVNFATQAAKKLNITADLAKYQHALAKAKELASKAGINLSDSQWETLIESAYKQAKDELESLVGTATPYTQDEIIQMIQGEVQKAVPGVPVDQITDLVKQEIGKMQLVVNVAPAPVPAPAPVTSAQ